MRQVHHLWHKRGSGLATLLGQATQLNRPVSDIIPRLSLKLLTLDSIQEVFEWYEQNLCNVELRDPRGYRVKFQCEHFVHLIKLTNKYGEEPRNRPKVIQEIRCGKLQFTEGRFNPQRASEIPWAVELATDPDYICPNWQALGTGNETYVRNFGTEEMPQWRVLVCKVIGRGRHFSTIFPREISQSDLAVKIWP